MEYKRAGQRITFSKRAVDTDGDYAEAFVLLPPGGAGPPSHIHTRQKTFFECLHGKLGLVVAGRRIALDPGQSYTVPANVPHSCCALENTTVKCRVVWKPALHIEYLLTEALESINGRGAGLAMMIDFSYIMRQIPGEYYLAKPSRSLQNALFCLLSEIGKRLGLVKAKPLD